MSNLVFTPAGGSPVTFSPAGVGFYRAAGKYWEERPAPDPPIYGHQEIEADGTDGVDEKISGFRGRGLGPYKTVYVAVDKPTLLAQFIADCDALAAKDVSVAVPDVSAPYPGCWLDAEGMAAQALIPRDSDALPYLEVGWIFKNKRLT